MSSTATIAPPSLPVTIGTELLAEFQDFNLRTKSELIGMKQGQYLVICTQHDMPGVRAETLKDKSVIVRYLYKGSVFGFKTRVLSLIHSPDRLVFLHYPEKIEEFRVRASQRYECILPATTIAGGVEGETVVVDISGDGCKCTVKASSLTDAEKFYQSMDINNEATLRVQFPGSPESYELTGSVKNINKDANRVAFGLHFGQIKTATKGKLEEFISLISEVKKKEP